MTAYRQDSTAGQGSGVGEEAPTRNPSGIRTRRADARPHAIRVALLGGFAVYVDGAEIRLPPAAPRLVALTALHRAPIRRPRLSELLWPHLDSQGAIASLRSTLSRLRAATPHLIAPGPGDVAIAEGVNVDVWEREELAVNLIENGDRGACHEAVADQLIVELLPGWHDDWVMFERDRLREVSMHALEAQAAAFAEDRRFARAITTVYAAIRLDPLRESAVRTLVEIHLAEGNRAQAARCYLDFRERLRTALRIEPSEGIRKLIAPLVIEAQQR